MLKTYRITNAYTDNYRIEAFESGKKVLTMIVAFHEVDGACEILNALGYDCTKREF